MRISGLLKIISKSVVCFVLAASITVAHGVSKDPIDLLNRIEVLFQELISFKDTDTFANYGFAVGGPHHEWLNKAKAIRETEVSMISFLGAYNFVPGDLLQLGMSYQNSEGRDTSYTSEMSMTLESAFATRGGR